MRTRLKIIANQNNVFAIVVERPKQRDSEYLGGKEREPLAAHAASANCRAEFIAFRLSRALAPNQALSRRVLLFRARLAWSVQCVIPFTRPQAVFLALASS